MQFFVDVLTLLLGAYLAFTNTVAGVILPYTGYEPPKATEVAETKSVVTEEPNDSFASLPSTYEFGGSIPKILIENSSYQGAAANASQEQPDTPEVFTEATTTEGYIRNALVNIYCQYKTNEGIRTTSGSGFFISERGVILTNAHIAQFLLFDGVEGVEASRCTVRGGNPAVSLYEAKLLYIPPTWITAHASLINVESPQGTGERDYALLYVSSALEGVALPDSFPYLESDVALLPRRTEGIDVFAAGFPAEAIYTDGPDIVLRPHVATSSVQRLYTFGSNYADLFSIGDSKVGEQGVSGGPIVREDGSVIGLIVTKGNEEIDGTRSLRAITLSYVDRTIREETGFTLEENTRGVLSERAAIFKDALIPFLQSILSFNVNG